jgi:hypothetical protein
VIKTNTRQWYAYGDAHPLGIGNGGTWLRPTSDDSFDIIKYYHGHDGIIRVSNLHVDTTDEWIDREAVMNYVGIDANDYDVEWFAMDCTDYYAPENFGDTYQFDESDKIGAVGLLKAWGIDV